VLPAENVVVQPRNRGTAAGILLPLLSVLERDPGGRIALLPSDHFVEREYVIESSLRLALESLDDLSEGITLLGITPDAPETGYGWIVPARSGELVRPVARFVEKPDQAAALELQTQGGLWNSFLMAAHGCSLLELYRGRLPGLLEGFQAAFAGAPEGRPARLAGLYAELGSHDFSRDLLQGSEQRLRLEVVPPCGWTDLGTPARVEACLAALREETELRSAILFPQARSEFDLARALRAMRATLSEGAAVLPA
jgi:mannose-1-phosphate guanylyltransferase